MFSVLELESLLSQGLPHSGPLHIPFPWLTAVHDYDKPLAAALGWAVNVRTQAVVKRGPVPRTECMLKTLLQAPPPYWPRRKCKLCLWISHQLFFSWNIFKSDRENAFPLEWNSTLLQSGFDLLNSGTGYWGRLQIASLKGLSKENNQLPMMSSR